MNQTEPRFSPAAATALAGAGWFAGRAERAQVAQWRAQLQGTDGFEMFPAAERLLAEFGGLHVEQQGPGEDHARESFEFDPTTAIGERELFDIWAMRLGTQLYPLGEYGSSGDYMAIADDGRVVLTTVPMRLIGRNIEEAIETMVAGRNTTVLHLGSDYPVAGARGGLYRAYDCQDEGSRFFLIEDENAREVIKVHRVGQTERTLRIEYELLGGGLSDATARRPIFDALLVALFQDRYRGNVNDVLFVNVLTKKAFSTRYEQPSAYI